MPDYSKGKVYTIRFHNSNDIYIGSTIQPLAKRLGGHKIKDRTINKLIEEKYNNDWSNCYIELYENYACNNKEELCKKEGEIIRLFINDENYNCINKRIECRKKKQYCEDNFEKIKEYKKEYYKENIEKIKERHKKYCEENKEKNKEYQKEYYDQNIEKLKEKFNCECGGCYTFKNKAHHFKTKKHQEYLTIP